MAKRMIPLPAFPRSCLALLATVSAILACSESSQQGPELTSLPQPRGSITFMEGNDCTQSVVAQLPPTWGQVVEADSPSGFVNDEARSVLLQDVPGDTLIRVFDSRDGDMSDDWAGIMISDDVSALCIRSFEDAYIGAAVTVEYHAVNGLDGKVSRVEILSVPPSSAGASTAPSPVQRVQTAQATAVMAPSETVPATRPPRAPGSATPPIIASVTPQRRSDLIVFTPEIIGSDIGEVEQDLGAPIEIYDLGIGEVEEVPDGGEERGYRVGRYTVYVTFDKDGIAHGIQVADGLVDDGFGLNDWPVVLARIGVDFAGLPNIVAPAARRWTNAYGYAIMVAADSIDGTVWTVRIYELPE